MRPELIGEHGSPLSNAAPELYVIIVPDLYFNDGVFMLGTMAFFISLYICVMLSVWGLLARPSHLLIFITNLTISWTLFLDAFRVLLLYAEGESF